MFRDGGCSASMRNCSAATSTRRKSRTRRSPRRSPRLGQAKLALFLHKPLFDQTVGETAITGRFVNPAPRRLLLAALGGVTPAFVACGHVHQYRETWSAGVRHVWGTSTAFVIPDRRQPRYGVKEVGYVEHLLDPDGGHESRLVRVPGVPTLDIAEFPEAYGPL